MASPDLVLTPSGLEPAFDLTSYYSILIYAVAVVLLALATLAATHTPILKPWKPTKVKNMPYESGMDPIGTAHMQFDIRFHLIAILFLVFDVELLFLYPWAATYQEGSIIPAGLRDVVFWEVQAFLLTVVVAYIYAWRRGVFKWR